MEIINSPIEDQNHEAANTDNNHPRKNPRQPKGLTLVGFLRADIHSRITARYFNHATRIGVNQPLINRKHRGEDSH